MLLWQAMLTFHVWLLQDLLGFVDLPVLQAMMKLMRILSTDDVVGLSAFNATVATTFHMPCLFAGCYSPYSVQPCPSSLAWNGKMSLCLSWMHERSLDVILLHRGKIRLNQMKLSYAPTESMMREIFQH